MFQKFHILWNYLTKGEDDMRQAFNKLDLNHDGYVSKEELTCYLKNSGLLPDESEEGLITKYGYLVAVNPMAQMLFSPVFGSQR